jgi:Meiotically up-regulated gene 113
MRKHNEQATRGPANAFAQERRPAHRQDQIVGRLVSQIGDGDQADQLMSISLRELLRMRRLGADITVGTIDSVVQFARDCIRARPVSIKAVTRPPGTPGRRGRFDSIQDVGEVVYYMRIGDRVKIGTSTNLRRRLKAINPEELLAIEQGGVGVESERHKQFSELRTHGEWFKLEGRLVQHIEQLRATP